MRLVYRNLDIYSIYNIYPNMSPKIMMISSVGGHLREAMLALESLNKDEVIFVSSFLPHQENLDINMVFITNPHLSIRGYIKNFFEAVRTYSKYRPKVVITTGAGIAIFLFIIARLMGARTIYIESGCRITYPSRTGRLLYPFSKQFIIQSPALSTYFPEAIYVSPLL